MTGLELTGPPGRGLSSAVLAHVRRQVARGYRPTSTWAGPVEYVTGPDAPAAGLADAPTGRLDRVAASLKGPARTGPLSAPATTLIGLVVPTHLDRGALAEQEHHASEVLARLDEAVAARDDITFVLFVGMQWLTDPERGPALDRLRALARLASGHPRVHFVGLALRGPLKVRTLNAAIAAGERLGLDAIGWIDDDVRLEPECWRRMVDTFVDRGRVGAVGATKVAHPRKFAASKLLHRAKAITGTATGYPHGCCILVATDVVAGGIPDRYVSDDGYVCFRLLDPSLEDPLRHLYLEPRARCHYHVAGPAGQTRKRVRRLLLNHHVFLADWPAPVSGYYLRQILFRGVWPLGGWDGRRGVGLGLAKTAIGWIYFLWFARVGAELYLRGLLNRPLEQITWAGYSERDVPELPSTATSPGRRP